MGRIALWVVLGILLAGTAASVQSAQAQIPEPYLTLEVTPGSTPIVPITELGTIPFTVGYACDTGTINPELMPVTIEMDVVSDADWVTAIVSPATVSFEVGAQDCAAGTVNETEGEVTVTFGTTAPAGETASFTLTATSNDTEPVDETWEETAAAYLQASASFDQDSYTATPGTSRSFNLTYTNGGNAPATATVALQESAPEGFDVTLPEPTDVDVGETETVEILVDVPGREGLTESRHEFMFDVSFTMEADPQPSSDLGLTTILEIDGLEAEDSPLSIMPLLLTLVGLLAWIQRRPR